MQAKDRKDSDSSLVVCPLLKSCPVDLKSGRRIHAAARVRISGLKTAQWREPVLSRVDESAEPTLNHTVCYKSSMVTMVR